MEAWETACGTGKVQVARTREAFAYCRRLSAAAEGLEFYLATALLPAQKRPRRRTSHDQSQALLPVPHHAPA